MKRLKIIVCVLRDEFNKVSVGIGKSQPLSLEDARYHYAALADLPPEVVERRLRARIIRVEYFERGIDG